MSASIRQSKLVLAIAAIGAVSALSVIAAPPRDGDIDQPQRPKTESMEGAQPDPTHLSFDELDIDKDGFIERSEAPAGSLVAQQFDALDLNHDGKLSREEFSKHT